jgi:hypothetical protein
MTPMAGRVANAHDYELVFCFGFIPRFTVPWKPIYRVVRVLQQIRRAFVNEFVGMLMGHVFFLRIAGCKRK